MVQGKLHDKQTIRASGISEERIPLVDKCVGKSGRSEFNSFLGEVPHFVGFVKYVVSDDSVAGHIDSGTIPRENIAPTRRVQQN